MHFWYHTALSSIFSPSIPTLHILQQIIQIIIIPAATPPVDNNLLLLLFLLLRHGVQQVLELVLGDLCAQLAGAGEHDEAVLDVGGAGLLDEADAAEAVGGFGGQDLGEDVGALVGWRELVAWVEFGEGRVGEVGL